MKSWNWIVVWWTFRKRAILKGFNDAIRGLYSIGGEEQYIFNVLNTTTPVIKEYERLTKDMGIDLIDVANFDRIYSI